MTVLKQHRIGKDLIEINFIEPYYHIEWREDAGNWMPWEIRADGTRHIMSEMTKDIEKAEKLYNEYIRRVENNG